MINHTLESAAKYIKTSETTLGELLVSGQIRAAKIGQSWCIPEKSLDDYLELEIERQTSERIEFILRGEKPRVKTARGRTPKPDLDKEFDKAA